MSENGLGEIWDGLRRLTAQLREGRYWTDRRDATQELFRIARQATWRVQQAARDRDPDVAHWGGQAVAELGRLTSAAREALDGKMDEELATIGLEQGEAAKNEDRLKAGDPNLIHGLKPALRTPTERRDNERGAPLASPEALLAWVEAFATAQGGTYAARPSGATLTLNLPGERRQTLYLDLGHKDSEGEPIALFYSVCGEAKPEHLLWALQVNSTLCGGAFGIIQRADRSLLIMLLRWRLAELTEAWLRQRLFYLARKADWAESKLKEKDEY